MSSATWDQHGRESRKQIKGMGDSPRRQRDICKGGLMLLIRKGSLISWANWSASPHLLFYCIFAIFTAMLVHPEVCSGSFDLHCPDTQKGIAPDVGSGERSHCCQELHGRVQCREVFHMFLGRSVKAFRKVMRRWGTPLGLAPGLFFSLIFALACSSKNVHLPSQLRQVCRGIVPLARQGRALLPKLHTPQYQRAQWGDTWTFSRLEVDLDLFSLTSKQPPCRKYHLVPMTCLRHNSLFTRITHLNQKTRKAV